MKIISTKEYQRLKNIEKKFIDIDEKYSRLIGEAVTLVNGEKTRRDFLLNLSKEELVHRYLESERLIELYDILNYKVELKKDSDIK